MGGGGGEACTRVCRCVQVCPCVVSPLSQVLDVLCSLCVCNAVAVRSNQNLITENLLPRRDLLLQTGLVNYVTRWVGGPWWGWGA